MLKLVTKLALVQTKETSTGSVANIFCGNSDLPNLVNVLTDRFYLFANVKVIVSKLAGRPASTVTKLMLPAS